tara:strand:- start:947 stop:1435 length:489 start_codon:yes stop_codon:yes gene_type:complete
MEDKEIRRQRRLRYKHSFTDLSSTIYKTQRKGSIKRGHEPPGYTLGELREWLRLQPNFDKLLIRWQETQDKWDRPSIDRLDSSRGYTFDNIQVLSFRDHMDKDCPKRPINQYDIDMNLIKEWPSGLAATRAGYNGATGVANFNKYCKTSGGFIWRWKDEVPV